MKRGDNEWIVWIVWIVDIRFLYKLFIP